MRDIFAIANGHFFRGSDGEFVFNLTLPRGVAQPDWSELKTAIVMASTPERPAACVSLRVVRVRPVGKSRHVAVTLEPTDATSRADLHRLGPIPDTNWQTFDFLMEDGSVRMERTRVGFYAPTTKERPLA